LLVDKLSNRLESTVSLRGSICFGHAVGIEPV